MTLKNYLGIYKIYQGNVTVYVAKYINLRTEKQN